MSSALPPPPVPPGPVAQRLGAPLLQEPNDWAKLRRPAPASAFASASFLLRLKLPGQGTSNLNGIGALLQPDDLAALQGPHVSEAGGELFPGRLRPAGVAPQGDDADGGLEELGAHGDEALEVLE